MKNPIKNSNHTAIIAGVVVASVASGALAYLFLSEKGKETRQSLKKKIRKTAKDAAKEVIHKKTKLSKKASDAVAEEVTK